MNARVLVIDHKDSFVFNLVDAYARRGCEVRTLRCDLQLEQLRRHLADFDPALVVLSPGPGRPETAGVTLPWLATRPGVPVLGVCLGHQALAVAAGGAVDRAREPVHGCATPIQLADDPLFEGMPRQVPAARYHSLCVTRVPDAMRVIAHAEQPGEPLVMAMRHRELPQVGVQFHPESFLTPWGDALLQRALRLAVAGDGAAHSSPDEPSESKDPPERREPCS